MENICEIVGTVIGVGSDTGHLVIDCKKKGSKYFCWTFNVEKKTAGEPEQKIFEIWLKDGALYACEYNGDDYQKMMDEFRKTENLMQCLQFMEIQKDVLSKENEKSCEPPEDISESIDSVSREEIDKAVASFDELAAQAAAASRRIK